jgi:hypothetical protein
MRTGKSRMKWFLRSCFLLAFAMLPAMVHANPLPLSPVPLPLPKSVPLSAPEFELATVSGGLAALVGAGWLLVGGRRNRTD